MVSPLFIKGAKMDQIWYPISELIADAYHKMYFYHKTQCTFKECDCENKLQQLQEFQGLFIGVN
jgi:hypothetical protein